MRWILAIAAVAALSFAVPMGMEAAAAKKPKNKLCAGTTLGGAKVTFTCKADEKCCFSAFLGQGQCVAASGVCL